MAEFDTKKSSNSLPPLHSIFENDDVVRSVLSLFVNNLPNYTNEINQNMQSGSLDKAAGVCHRLKGTAGGYGYPEIACVATDLEHQLLSAAPKRDSIEDLYSQLLVLERRALSSLPH